MKVSRYLVLVVIAGVFAVSVSSCKKVREDVFIKGLWKMNALYIDTITTNQLANLPHFTDGNNCCDYRLAFEDNDVLLAYYFTYDTLNSSYYSAGTWRLVDYNTMYIKIGDYIDGNFEIHKPSTKKFQFTGAHNHIKAYDGIYPDKDTTLTTFEIEKI